MESFREMSKEELQAQEVEVNKKYQEFKDLHLSLNMARGKQTKLAVHGEGGKQRAKNAVANQPRQ